MIARFSAIVCQVFPHTLLKWQGDQLMIWRPFPGESAADANIEEAFYVPEEPNTELTRRYWGSTWISGGSRQ